MKSTKQRRIAVSDRLDSIVDRISYSGPFDIIRTLDTVPVSERKGLYKVLAEPENRHAVAQLMYFQKYLAKFLPDVEQAVQEIAVGSHRRYNETAGRDALPYALSQFQGDARNLIANRINYLQSVQGCSSGCYFCGVDAAVGVKDRVPVPQVKNLLNLMKGGWLPHLNWANDPLLISQNIDELIEFLQFFHGAKERDNIITSIPPGTEEAYRRLVSDTEIPLQVSLSDVNLPRLYMEGITRIGSIREIPEEVPSREFAAAEENLRLIFNRGYLPTMVHFRNDGNLRMAGMNLYDKPGEKKPISSGGLVMTPYGVVNTVSTFKEPSEQYPQGLIVVAVDHLFQQLLALGRGQPIDPYLRYCALDPSMFGGLIDLKTMKGRQSVMLHYNKIEHVIGS